MSCSRRDNPQAALEHARLTFQHGDLIHSQQEAEEGYRQFSRSSPDWAWRFRILQAESLLWRGKYPEVLTLLDSPTLPPVAEEDVVAVLALQGIAHARQHDFQRATQKFEEAERLCVAPAPASCGKAFQGRGLFALGQNRFLEARQQFERSLSFARSNGDRFLESTSLLNLGGVLVKEGRFDEAVDRSDAAYTAATALDAGDLALAAQENLGWAYYRLGDSDRALGLFLNAEKRAAELGDIYDQENALTNIGYIYMDSSRFNLAEQSFQRALAFARSENSKEHVLNALRVLARLTLRTGDVNKASDYAEQALQIARESGNHLDELYPSLVQGQIAAHRGDSAGAKQTFKAVEQDKVCPLFLKWEAQHSLARLYADSGQTDAADREYRAALATFEAARADVRHEDFHFSFLTNGWRIYDDYVHFLVARGKTDAALRWADHSRARTLAEGLGLLSKGASVGPPPLNAQEIARRADGTLLYYWLGEKQSFLWTITPRKTSLFQLPPASEIETAAKRYRQALGEPADVLGYANSDGQWLYRTLIAPARALLPKGAKIFIIPDGSLNNLNFETLLVTEPKLHYWIQDATIANASSLRVLGASYATRKKNSPRLLLIGDSVAPGPEYPELPKAAAQVDSVARHFPTAQQVFRRAKATPAAYLASQPEQFSHIHFVAHGIASRLSPLDSAIVLSRGNTENDSFKLYARDIIRRPLRADLVTISACYGTGTRSYSGEGLVGLSWAFLRAGARNVIAALWEVTDTSTQQLMDKFYDELDKGQSPDDALRAAKLSLLGSAFHNPYYWAPFQLYRGGRA